MRVMPDAVMRRVPRGENPKSAFSTREAKRGCLKRAGRMARAPWEPREGETEEERETRLAADDVHRRLEQARLRELEEAYWRSRATSSAPDADSAKRNDVGARSATPRATLAGVRDAAPSTRARASTRGDGGGGLISDLEVQELARAASRVGATPDVSRRVAEEVLAAERVAVDAAMRRASARRSSARAASSLFPRASTPRTRPVAFDTPADAETATKASRRAAAASRRDPQGGDDDDDDDDDGDDDDDSERRYDLRAVGYGAHAGSGSTARRQNASVAKDVFLLAASRR